VQSGEGDDVLLLCGLGDDLTAWDAQVGPFGERYRVSVVDNRGVGRSSLPDGDTRDRLGVIALPSSSSTARRTSSARRGTRARSPVVSAVRDWSACRRRHTSRSRRTRRRSTRPCSSSGRRSDSKEGPVIARIWRGAVRPEDADEYAAYMRDTGVGEYRTTPGNQGAWILRRRVGALTEVVAFSLWDDMDAVRGFAGDDPSRAVYYPEDDRWLVERSDVVEHYEVD
jgi:heme-degrading monooxygenase HmoA